MRFSLFFMLIGFMFLILVGCSKESSVDDKAMSADEQTAEQYVIANGYTIVSDKGLVNSYTLEKSKLSGGTESIPYQQTWGVQNIEPEAFFGKEINIYGFTVSNHPLEKEFQTKTNVYVMLSESKVIGGYSFPDVEGLLGACYSLDGKTLEEVTGLTFSEWRDDWKKKYGN